MLSIGWTEMMLVAAVALIVVGPRDLPAMLRQIGKAVGSVRKMGNEFKTELNKITAVDEIRDIKRSIAAPLTETRASIEKEFNSISKTGQVVPSGKIKPADPNAQSVVDEIHAAAGMGTSLEENGAAAKASIAAAVTRAAKSDITPDEDAKTAASKTAASKTATPKTAAPKPRRARAKPKTAVSKTARSEIKADKNPKTTAPKPKRAPAKPKTAARKSAGAKPVFAKSVKPKTKATAARKPAASKTGGAKPVVAKSAARKTTQRKVPVPKTAPAQTSKAD